MLKTSVIAIRIARPYAEAYDFLANPANLPTWMPAMGPSFRHLTGNDWIADRPHWPIGSLVLRFTPRNAFGVLDTQTIMIDHVLVHTPIRLTPYGEGCELFYTLHQRSDQDDAAFASDEEWLRSDLHALKSMLESPGQ